MIENIRKYTGLMIVVLVLLFIGLVFLENSVQNAFAGQASMVIDGKKISVNDYRRKGANPLSIAGELSYTPLSEGAKKLAAKYVGEKIANGPFFQSSSQVLSYLTIAIGQQPNTFLANRIAVQEAGLDYGVTPGAEEVTTFIQNVIFADPDGKFDAKAYDSFLSTKLGRLGLDSRSFNEYVRDLLTAQNLSNVIGGALAPDPQAIRTSYLAGAQSISGQQITLTSSKLENDQEPSEEEIKAYWEENQDQYNSDEKRSVSYIMIEPDWAAKLKEIEEKKAEDEKKRKEAEAERKAKEEEELKKAQEAAKKANEEAAAKKEETTEETPAETTPEEPSPSEEGAEGQEGEEGEPAPAVVEEVTEKVKDTTAVIEQAAKEITEQAEEKVTEAIEGAEKVIEAATPAVTIAPVTPAAPKAETPVKPVVKEQTPKEKLDGVQKTEAVKAINEKANQIWQAALDAAESKEDPIAALKEAGKEDGYEIKTAEAFTESNPPKDLDVLATDQGIGKLANVVFKLPANGAIDEKLSNPYRTADGYFIGVLGDVIESQPLTYEEAKVKATVDLKKKMAREALKKQAEEAQTKLAAAIKEGKDFAEVAKELELEVKPANNLSKPVTPAQYRAQGFSFPTPPAFTAAMGTDPGQVSKPHFTPNEEEPESAILVFVEKREFKDDQAFASGLDSQMETSTEEYRKLAFQIWLQNEYSKRNVQVITEN